jgi:hypothetical protein
MKIIFSKKHKIQIKVSDIDYEQLNKLTWCVDKGYAITNIRQSDGRYKPTPMHNYIYYHIIKHKKQVGVVIDHININSLDNTRDNLRLATYSQNGRNRNKLPNSSSKYYGVSIKDKKSKIPRWVSILTLPFLQLRKQFKTQEEAAWQYNVWVKENKMEEWLELNNVVEPVNFKNHPGTTKTKQQIQDNVARKEIASIQKEIIFINSRIDALLPRLKNFHK